MIGGMDRPKDVQRAQFDKSHFRIFVGAILAALLWGVSSDARPYPLAAALWTICGLSLIATNVRWINGRDDPRHQKRPPDAP